MQCKLSKRLKGSMYVDTAISTFIICIVIAVGLAVLPIVVGQYMLSVELHSVARDISITGEYTSSTITVNSQTVQIELDPESNFYKLNDDRLVIQLGDKFSISASVELHMSVGGFANVTVPLKASASGRSEKYWKELEIQSQS